MNWMQTYSGIKFNLDKPDPKDVCIEDIAHALSRIGRYTGHANRFYSVAQHSVLVALQCPRDSAFEGLMHDAHEAYCDDFATPMKNVVEGYREFERSVRDAVVARFNLRRELPASVKLADLRMLMTEKEQLFNEQISWSVDADPYDFTFMCWEPKHAEREFLVFFDIFKDVK